MSAPINSCFNVVVWVGSKWLLAFLKVPVTPRTHLAHFLPCCPLNDRRRVAHSFFKIGCQSPLSCRSSSPHSSLSFDERQRSSQLWYHFSLLSVRRKFDLAGRSAQCCTCSKWICLRCSLLFLRKFKTLRSSHFWSCVPTSSDNTVTSYSDFFSLYTSTVQSVPTSSNAALLPHPRLQISIPLPPILYFFLTTASCSRLSLYCSCLLFPLTPSGLFNEMLRSPS